MSSSDSAEDFESADEDLDHSSKPKTDAKSKDVCSKEVVELQVQTSDKVSESVLQQLDNLKLVNEPKVKHNQDNTNNIDSDVITKAEEVKTKPSIKKLGTKLTSNSKNSDSLRPVSNTQNKKEEISERQKDENLNETRKNIVNVDTKETKSIVTLTTESTTFEREATSLTTEAKSLDVNLQGDGWEIEEEDGFEVPVSLTKLSTDGGIQSPREQICEIDQDERLSKEPEQDSQGWGGWGGWGVSSLLSTATGSVTTFSSQVTAGLSTVLETTVGAPDPESLAAATVKKQNEDAVETKKVEEESPTNENKTSTGYSGFGSLVSGVSFLGSTVINRGLDTLETLGKKTMEVLQEGDPGLMKKRAMLFPNQDKTVLSQILREAKEKADHSDKEKEEKETARKAHFESLFDDFQGMVHLEALEMLSTQCELKLQSLLLSQTGAQLLDLQETLSQVRDLCEIPDDDDEIEVLTQEQFAEKVNKSVNGLNIKISAAKIIQINNEIIGRLSKVSTEEATIVNQTAISSLAEFTAAGMECFHKSAELLLAKPLRNTPDEAENYTQITILLCGRVSTIANEFTQLLTKNHPIANSSLITNIFLEASNSCSYMKNACQLLIPILQVGAIL